MKYTPETVETICELIAEGKHNIEDVCEMSGITTSTFHKWKSEKSDFSDALKKAEKLRLDSLRGRAASGLAKLLDTHEVEESTIEYVDKAGKRTIKSQKVTKRVIMPSAAAIIYTLNNRDPESWRQTKHIEVSGNITPIRPDLSALTPEQLRNFIATTRQIRAAQQLALPEAPAEQ